MPCPNCNDTGFDARPFGPLGLEPVGVCDCRLTQSPAQSRDRAISERKAMAPVEYEEGFDAYVAGVEETKNPYDAETQADAHMSWNDGWMAAQNEAD